MLPVLLINRAFFNFGQSWKTNSKDVCSDVWLGGFWILFLLVVRHVFYSVTDSQQNYCSVYIAEILPNPTTMPTILLLLILLGVLYSHGHAMSQEEKRRFRWVEKTAEQLRCPLLTTWHIRWLADSFLPIEGIKWLRCLIMPIRIIWWVVFQKKHKSAFKELQQVVFLWKSVAKV